MKKGSYCKVAVVLRLAYGSGRDILYGISRYARKHYRWQLHIINFSGDDTLDEIRRAERKGVDGIIANGLDNAVIADHFSRSATPLVVIGARSPGLRRRINALAFVRNDDADIGRFGANYLSSLGLARSYGFVDWTATGYASILRREGFMSRFNGTGADVRTYSTTANLENGSLEDITALSQWLAGLPKPAAVMAVHDLRAIHVLEAAALSGIKIPRELALIGVDNDELLCDTAEPTLTSIAPDHIHLGELAAEALNGLMTDVRSRTSRAGSHRLHALTIRSSVKTIVERQSAKPVTPATRLVEQATAFIRRNALKGIGAMDVVNHLGVSRRLADMRFRQFTGQSILAAILKARLDEVKRRLRDTDTPIAKLTAACGFKGENYAKKLFRSRFGMSMSAWRAQHSLPPHSCGVGRLVL